MSLADKGEAGLRWDELDSDSAVAPLEILREKSLLKKGTDGVLVYFIFACLNVKQCDHYLGLKIKTISYLKYNV